MGHFSFLHVSEHSEHLCFFPFFGVKKELFSQKGGTPPPLAEISAKIMNSILLSFPNDLEKNDKIKNPDGL